MVSISKLLALLATPALLLAHPTAKSEGTALSPGSHGLVPKEILARGDGDIDHIAYGDGWCVAFSKVPVFSRILWRLAQNVVGDFENSGLWYGRAVGGKWTVEIKRSVVNNGYSDPGYVQAAWNRLKSGTFVRSGEVFYVGEHSMTSIGQYGGDGEEANRIEVWITTLTNWGPEFYQVLKRDGTGNETAPVTPPIKADEKYLEENVWKGPDPAYLELLKSGKPPAPFVPKPEPKPVKSTGKLSKRAKYWDACTADDDNNQFYNRAVDTSVGDCMWVDQNNQYWTAEKASFPNLWSTFPCGTNKYLCCNQRCTRDQNSCCPEGLNC
ncbi:hypothetical protein ABW20_dc0102717 [Dactylellina cionopaga]|nr:hypothetical protein ABW20_dc0102717 [Dactylellina cionopaga]